MTFPEAWEELAFVSISAQNGTDIEFATITETIDVDAGEKQGEGVANIGGGRIWKVTPETDTTVTFEGYPISLGKAPLQGEIDAEGLSQMFHELRANWDATQPLSVSNTRQRELYRIAMLWTNQKEWAKVNTGVTETVLSDTTTTWSSNNLTGQSLLMTTGTAKGKLYRITSNTADAITCAAATMISDGTATGDGYRVIPTGKGAVHFGYEGYRYKMENARMVSAKPSFTDGILKVTFAFKVPAFKKDGTANITEQSGDGTTSSSLPDSGNYT